MLSSNEAISLSCVLDVPNMGLTASTATLYRLSEKPDFLPVLLANSVAMKETFCAPHETSPPTSFISSVRSAAFVDAILGPRLHCTTSPVADMLGGRPLSTHRSEISKVKRDVARPACLALPNKGIGLRLRERRDRRVAEPRDLPSEQ